MRLWINGSFMRSSLVEAEMKAFDVRMLHVERAIERLIEAIERLNT
jgi:hypothetical protein